MAIITISRELAALGDETARCLATLMNYRFVDKPALEERVKSLGIAEKKFEKYDERKPSFLASLSQDRDDYLHYLKTAILAEAGAGNCVLMGRGASVILKNVPGVFSVFLTASEEVRMARVKSYFHCDEKRAAQILEQSDSDREGFHRYFFDTGWEEAGNYHMALNTGIMSPNACAEIIRFMIEKTITSEDEAKNSQSIQDLTLGQKIKHHIIYEKEVPVHFLEAQVIRGESGLKIKLYGVANSQSLVEAAVGAGREAVSDVPGGADVSSDIQVVREYTVMP